VLGCRLHAHRGHLCGVPPDGEVIERRATRIVGERAGLGEVPACGVGVGGEGGIERGTADSA